MTRGEGLTSKQVATFVILILMAMVLSFIDTPLIPGVDWLTYDPSGVVVGLTALLWGPWQGVAVAALSWIPHLATGFLGASMNIMASASMAVVFGSLCRRRRGVARVALAGAASVAAATVVSVCLNFVVTPMYLSTTYEAVAALVVPYLLPFNVIKAAANVTLAAVAYFKLRALLAEGDGAEKS